MVWYVARELGGSLLKNELVSHIKALGHISGQGES